MDKKNLFIYTFGCQMNVHDSEKIAALMENSGYASVDDVGKADLIIINTCSIREKAAQKVYSQLGRLKKFKKKKTQAHHRSRGLSCSTVGSNVH